MSEQIQSKSQARRFLMLIACVVLAAQTTGLFAGQVESEAQADMGGLIKQLADKDPNVRENATRLLYQRTDLTDGMIIGVLKNPINDEQSHRIMSIAQHRFLAAWQLPEGVVAFRSTQGCLGIILGGTTGGLIHPVDHPSLSSPAVIVNRTRPGFPAHHQLQSGDLIYHVNGEIFPPNYRQQDFIEKIKGFKGGDVLRLGILRGTQKVDVDVQLDFLDRLNDVEGSQGINPERSAKAAWEQERIRLLSHAKPIKVFNLNLR